MLIGRSAMLVYHGYKHDFMSSEVAASEDSSPMFDGGGGVTVGAGRKWTSLAGLLHDLFIMMNASFEGGFGVWGGKKSEIGKLTLHFTLNCFYSHSINASKHMQ